MEELAAYDPSLVPGILGGSSGTTYYAFKLLEDAKKYGARAALFGRKINNCEHQLTFVTYLRAIADGQMRAEDAVKAYHGDLERLKLKPHRPLKDDLAATTTATSYAGTESSATVVKPVAPAPAKPGTPAERPKVKVTMSSSGLPAAARSSFPRKGEAPAAGPSAARAAPAANGGLPKKADGSPDFSKMTGAQKVAYARERNREAIARNGNGDGQR
jgi:hypothetical protein